MWTINKCSDDDGIMNATDNWVRQSDQTLAIFKNHFAICDRWFVISNLNLGSE